MEVTQHGKERIKERLGVSKKISDKIAEKALRDGIRHGDTSGSLNRFLDSLYLSHGTANNMRIYNHKVFIFCNEKLITIINLPSKYFNAVNKINNKRR